MFVMLKLNKFLAAASPVFNTVELVRLTFYKINIMPDPVLKMSYLACRTHYMHNELHKIIY